MFCNEGIYSEPGERHLFLSAFLRLILKWMAVGTGRIGVWKDVLKDQWGKIRSGFFNNVLVPVLFSGLFPLHDVLSSATGGLLGSERLWFRFFPRVSRFPVVHQVGQNWVQRTGSKGLPVGKVDFCRFFFSYWVHEDFIHIDRSGRGLVWLVYSMGSV